MNKKNKQGLSTIVTTLLILLLIFVAVGVIWVVVRNVIQEGSEQISLGKFTLDLKISQVQITNDSAIKVKVKRNSGAGDFVALNFVVDDGDDSEVVELETSLEELEEKYFDVNLVIVSTSNIKSIKIAPVFRLESGKEVIGPVKDEYEISAGTGGGGTCNDTCTSLGYECGTQTVCGSSTNCGTCNSGYVCSGSSCVEESSCNDTCTSLGYECGTQTVCGSSTNCGTCSAGYVCSSGTCVEECTDTCSSLGYECGTQTVCGSSTNCGSCNSSSTCQSGTCVMGCNDTCTSLGYECGTQTVCGSSTNCGTCSAGYVCSSGTCVEESSDWQTGLISWWKFDGDATDSVGSNDGTPVGVTLTSDCKSGQCYDFNGSNDYVLLPNSTSLDIQGTEITISAWVKPEQIQKSQIWNKRLNRNTNTIELMYTDATNHFVFVISDATTKTECESTSSMTAGQWVHVVGVYDGSQMAIYLNDVKDTGTCSRTAPLPENDVLPRIGSRADGTSELWNGIVDEVMIWDRALTPTEISSLYDYFD